MRRYVFEVSSNPEQLGTMSNRDLKNGLSTLSTDDACEIARCKCVELFAHDFQVGSENIDGRKYWYFILDKAAVLTIAEAAFDKFRREVAKLSPKDFAFDTAKLDSVADLLTKGHRDLFFDPVDGKNGKMYNLPQFLGTYCKNDYSKKLYFGNVAIMD